MIPSILLIAASLGAGGEISWQKQHATDIVFSEPLYSFEGLIEQAGCRLSDLDKKVSKDESATKDSLVAFQSRESVEFDQFAIQSPRDTCGLTYIIDRKLRQYSLAGVLLKRPNRFERGVFGHLDSASVPGLVIGEYATEINGKFRIRPSLATVANRKGVDMPWKSYDSIFTQVRKDQLFDSVQQEKLYANELANLETCGAEEAPPSSTSGSVSGQTEIRSYAIKPMIYLYPTRPMDVTVTLDPSIRLVSVYPKIVDRVWAMKATPSGELTDPRNSKKYYGLFWDAQYWEHPAMDSGFVTSAEDFPELLDSLLEIQGLDYREREECVTFWLSKISPHPWVKFAFHGEEFAAAHPVSIVPKPDTFLRVFVVIQPLDSPQTIAPQRIRPGQRKGFTAIEWGGEIRR